MLIADAGGGAPRPVENEVRSVKKQIFPAVLAALLLLMGLSGCARPAEQPDSSPEPPVSQEPQKPVQTPSQESPDQPPSHQDGYTFLPIVQSLSKADTVEECVSYQIAVPQVQLENEAAEAVINDYYQRVAAKAEDYAWGEAYEEAMEAHCLIQVNASYTVELCTPEVLSVFRQVVTEAPDGTREVIYGAETFRLSDGGLLTADDCFTVPEADYSQLLLDRVKAQLEAGGGEDAALLQRRAEETFDPARFYLTEDCYVVYYQENDLDADAFQFPIQRTGEEDGLAGYFRMPD